MYLFREQIHLVRNRLTGIREFIKFIVKVYIPSWYESTSPINAPLNDLNLIKRIIKYETVNKKLSEAAFHSFSRHLWYLSEPLVAMAFFDERIDVAEKLKMVRALANEASSDYAKRPTLTRQEVSSKTMSNFVTKNTFNFMREYSLNTDWLFENPNTWPKSPGYIEAKRLLQQIEVVNDCADRAVKLVADFNGSLTKGEMEFQNLLKTVDHHRQIFKKDANKAEAFSRRDDFEDHG